MTPSPIRLRAATDADYAFCKAVGHDGIRPHAERSGGWDQARADLEFEADWDTDAVSIIEREGRPVGYVLVASDGVATVLEGIYVQAQSRNQGIGSEVIRRLLASAVSPVRLRVFKVNPAHGLYVRLGFAAVSETATHYVMEHPGRV